MKVISLLIILFSSISLFSQSKKIKIKIEQFLPYCGGARPTPEMQAKQKIAIPFANKKLIYISDKQKIDTVVTDKNGFIKTSLTYGIYMVFEPWKYYKKLPMGIQESNLKMDCLKEEWKKEDLKITITKKNITVIDNFKYPKCMFQFPCLITTHFPQ